MKPASPLSKTDLLLSWVVAAIFILLPFHAIFTTWLGSNFDHLDLFRVWKELILVAIFPVVLWVAWKSTKTRQWLVGSWIVRLFALYAVLHGVLALQALHNHNVNQEALIYGLIINLRFIAFFIICYILAANNAFLKKNWRPILLAPALLVIFFGLLQKFILPHDFLRHFGYGPETIPAYQTVDSDINYRRIQSTLRGANPLGAYLVLIIPALLLTFRKSRKLVIATNLTALVVLFFSYSRSAWIGLALVSATLVWLAQTQKNKKLLTAIAAILSLIVITGAFLVQTNKDVQDTLLHTSDYSSVPQSSNDARLKSLESGSRDVIHQPLGEGPGTAGPASFRNDHPPRIAENYYLQIGQEVGWLGICLFVAINILVAQQLWRRKGEALPLILFVSLVGLSIVNLLSHAWTDDTLSLLWWGLAGIALAPAILGARSK